MALAKMYPSLKPESLIRHVKLGLEGLIVVQECLEVVCDQGTQTMEVLDQCFIREME
jgi:hypothetical protein